MREMQDVELCIPQHVVSVAAEYAPARLGILSVVVLTRHMRSRGNLVKAISEHIHKRHGVEVPVMREKHPHGTR